MKKILQFTMLLSIILLCFSCNTSVDETNNGDSGSGENENLLDLRNITADGKSYRNAKNGFSYKYVEKNGYYYGPGSDWEHDFPPLEWTKNTITLDDCEDGFKVTFHTPDEKDCPPSNVDWFNITYVDDDGNEAATVSLPNNLKDSFNQGNEKTFDLVFPLTLPGRTISIFVNYGYVTKDYYNEWPLDPEKGRVIKLCYTVNTAHGKAIPKRIKKNFDPNDHVIIAQDGKTLKTEDLVPPDGIEVRRAVQIFEIDKLENGFENQICCKDFPVPQHEPTEEPIPDNFSIDLTKYVKTTGNSFPYFYAIFYYIYKLEDYPDLEFTSCKLKTKTYDNTEFRGSLLDSLIAQNNVVKVSETEYKGTSAVFRDLLKALIGLGTNFKLTVTDKTLPENFFQSLCWEDLNNVDYTYTLDLSETEIEVIPGWITLNQFYGGNCKKITGVILPDTIKKIEDGAFRETSIESVIIPDSCEWIGAAVLPESSYTNYKTKKIIISDDDYSNWKALDFEDDLIDKWNKKETKDSYDLETTGFNEWSRHFKVDK